VLGRVFSDSFAGIAPASAPGFVVAELVGAAAGLALHRALSAVEPSPMSRPAAPTTVPVGPE
jgi:hypothetical protein